MWEVDPDLPVDPAADLLREMTERGYEASRDDVRKNGQQEPAIVRRNPDGEDWSLLGGRHRQRACRDLARKLLVRERDGHGDAAEYVWPMSAQRRRMDANGRAEYGARLKKHYETDAARRMKAGEATDPGAEEPRGAARGLAGQKAGVSGKVIDAAEKILGRGSPELLDAFRQKLFGPTAGAPLAGLPDKELKEVLAGGPTAIAGKLRAVRAARAPKPGAGTRPGPAKAVGEGARFWKEKPAAMAAVLVERVGPKTAAELVKGLGSAIKASAEGPKPASKGSTKK